jgi:transcriptional regulator with XRE-family HTH domain
MTVNVVIADRLRERMQALGLSQAELARRVGVRQPTIFKLTTGGGYGSKHLHRIARELQTTPAYLTGETDDPVDGAPPEPVLSYDERELVECNRGLTVGDRALLLQLARSLPKHDRVASPPNPGAGLPPEPALAQMFEGMLAQLDPKHPGEHAELLARRLPTALAQLTDLLPSAAPVADATPRRPRPTPVAAPPS